MKRGDVVVYIDGSSKEHNALVVAINGLHEGVASLAYVDEAASDAREAIKLAYDVPHADDEARDETNPELPRYVVNAWKLPSETHVALPDDHPHFEHPFAKAAEAARTPVPAPVVVHEPTAEAGAAQIAAVAAEQQQAPEQPAQQPAAEQPVAKEGTAQPSGDGAAPEASAPAETGADVPVADPALEVAAS